MICIKRLQDIGTILKKERKKIVNKSVHTL